VSRVRLSRIFWIGAAAILVAAALVALAAVVRGDFSESDGRILVTLAALLYTGGSALAGLALAERGPAEPLGWAVAAAAPVCLALVGWGIWSFVFDGGSDYDATRAAWSAVLVLLVGLVATTGLLLARTRVAAALAWAAAALAGLAAALSVAGIWTEPEADAYVKALAALWILAALCYFLAPVLQRFTATGVRSADRVLAELDGIELVATRAPSGLDARLARGERLELRRRS
jgi:hypothetical protein